MFQSMRRKRTSGFSWQRAVAREFVSLPAPSPPTVIPPAMNDKERLAKADRRLAATSEQWDADPWLLNTPDGIIDLRTGNMRIARPEDYCTKITAVAPSGECPLWQSFLFRITGGSESLLEFLQIILGYSLTGITREHALFFLYGTGANGKSVFVSTVAGILSDYHSTAAIETFTAHLFPSPFGIFHDVHAWIGPAVAQAPTLRHVEHVRQEREATVGSDGRVRLGGMELRHVGGGDFQDQAAPECWLGRWAMNLMLINVSTRKLKRAVRLPDSDLPTVAVTARRNRRPRVGSWRSLPSAWPSGWHRTCRSSICW